MKEEELNRNPALANNYDYSAQEGNAKPLRCIDKYEIRQPKVSSPMTLEWNEVGLCSCVVVIRRVGLKMARFCGGAASCSHSTGRSLISASITSSPFASTFCSLRLVCAFSCYKAICYPRMIQWPAPLAILRSASPAQVFVLWGTRR